MDDCALTRDVDSFRTARHPHTITSRTSTATMSTFVNRCLCASNGSYAGSFRVVQLALRSILRDRETTSLWIV